MFALSELLEVRKLASNDKMLAYSGVKDYDGFVPKLSEGFAKETFAIYQLKFRTLPGNALYEATVEYDERTTTDYALVNVRFSRLLKSVNL